MSPQLDDNTGQLPGLTPDERALLKKMFSSPLDIPQEWLAWMVSYLEAHPPQLPMSQIFGYTSDSISCRLTRTADQSGFSGGVRASVVWQDSRWNTGEMWDATDPTKVSIKVRGKYLAWFSAEFAVAGGDVAIWSNGAIREATTTGVPVTTILDLEVGDYLTAEIVPASSGTVLHKENNHTPEFAVTRVGP